MFGYDSKLFLREIMVVIGQREVEIELVRQFLASHIDFEPYMVFKRFDQKNSGLITAVHLLKVMKENGYRDLQKTDFSKMLIYFNISNKQTPSMNFEEFLQFVLPCNNPVLRC